MTLLDLHRHPSAPVDPAGADAPVEAGTAALTTEALIREARRRTRRRRIRRLVVLAVVAGSGAAALAITDRGPGGVIAETSARPFANLRAFRGRGELAFVSRGQVWVLDGTRGTLRRLPVPAGDTPSSPVFSHDGRWLAYLVDRGRDPYGPSALWIAHADGAGARRIRGLAVGRFVGWSPGADLVAVAVGDSTHVPVGSPTALDLVSPGGRARTLFTPSAQRPATMRGAIWSAVWSPDGRALAVSTYSPTRTRILGVPVAPGARPTVWFSIAETQRLTGALSCGGHCGDTEAIAELAGWWRHRGIAFWVFSSGMTHNSDSTPLAALAAPGSQPRRIAQTLSDGTTDAVAAGRGGELALVASSDEAGREYAVGKTVEVCAPGTSHCTALPGARAWTGRPLPCRPCFGAPAQGPGSAVSLDPAWSPDGHLLAYVKAPAYRAAAGPSLAWFGAHELDIWNARTDTIRRIGAIGGASLPTWSRDGRSLLYVNDDGLWLTNAATGNAVEIEHPLYRESAWRRVATTGLAFYGQIPWSRQFSWYAP